ncbi:MAG TPA: helix-turn-helix domain-containing protein [Thermoanaerobaculia bacterium]|nr:helix-turn-helix domain-containing protein [Thermoanaerobaculia bacterium]
METPKEDPEDLRITILFLRSLQGWTQKELAAAIGIAPSVISEYEKGRRKPTRAAVERIALATSVPLRALDHFLPALRRFRKALEDTIPPGEADFEAAIETLVVRLGHVLRESGELFLNEASRSVIPPRPEDRETARELWARLAKLDPDDRRLLVEEGSEYQTWALCERLCHESAEAAGKDADHAVELADLALVAAALAPGSPLGKLRLLAYAWGHLGNARRAKGDLPGAQNAFRRAESFWRAGAGAEPDLLDESRLLALAPSLSRVM